MAALLLRALGALLLRASITRLLKCLGFTYTQKREHSDVEYSRNKTMKKRTMKELLLQLLLDGVAKVVLEIWQIFLQDVGLLVVDVGAGALAIFVGHGLVINFDAEVVLGYVVSLIEQDVADELCYVDVLRVALDVSDGQLVKFNVHSVIRFWVQTMEPSDAVYCNC